MPDDDDDSPEPVEAAGGAKGGSVREWLLAGIAVISLALNGYLAYDKWKQEKVAQPGPNVARVFIDGANSAALEEMHKTAQAFSEMYSHPSIAATPDWTTLIAEQKKLPPIALRNQTIRFLTIQNFTSSAYEAVKVAVPSRTIADIGTLAPSTTVMVYYNSEAALSEAEVLYRVAGSNAIEHFSVPQAPRDSVELITKISTGGLRSLGSLHEPSDRLDNLLEILGRGAN
jgi:hypothetical protein